MTNFKKPGVVNSRFHYGRADQIKVTEWAYSVFDVSKIIETMKHSRPAPWSKSGGGYFSRYV